MRNILKKCCILRYKLLIMFLTHTCWPIRKDPDHGTITLSQLDILDFRNNLVKTCKGTLLRNKHEHKRCKQACSTIWCQRTTANQICVCFLPGFAWYDMTKWQKFPWTFSAHILNPSTESVLQGFSNKRGKYRVEICICNLNDYFLLIQSNMSLI